MTFLFVKFIQKGVRVELANKVIESCEKNSYFSPIYDINAPIKEKIAIIAHKIYHASNAIYSPEAENGIREIEKLGRSNLPICIAKTQYSISDDPRKLGAPKNFEINIKDIYLSNGAEFIVVIAGSILRMPGLPKTPAAECIDVDGHGKISGLF